MKKLKLQTILIMICLIFTQHIYSQSDSTTLNSSVISSNVTLNASTTYLMKGLNFIKNGATIVIPPGTIIKGDYETKGTLIIERGAKIYANGTLNQPIVFTSEKPIGQRQTGDWGGIIILGRAGINTSTGVDSAEIEGFGAGLGPIYGGQPRIDNDSSGVLRFVRLEFPGVNLTSVPGNEINGLTMGGVGSRTVIEYVQVSYCGDDSFEWFGGTVNCKYLISYKPIDDDWDTDNGFRGCVQFGLSVRDTSYVDVSTSNGFETDNNNNSPTSGSYNSPRTKPIFSNMTVIGPYINTGLTINPLWGRGLHERRCTQTCIYNSLIVGWKVGSRFDGCGVINAASGDTIQMRNNIYAGNLKLADTASNSGCSSFNAHIWLQNASYSNSVLSTASSLGLINPFGIYPDPSGTNINNWMPTGSSPALSGANFSNSNLGCMEVVSFRGAFGSINWSSGWAVFNPKDYIIGIKSVSSEIPSEFSLSQNYPNPFNPNTVIKFQIAKLSNAKIVIYDVIGREVTTLVDEQLKGGTYEVDFDGKNYSSGIYYYKLITDGFSETRKMILIK